MNGGSRRVTGFVYFAVNRERGLVRIGFGVDPKGQVKGLQTASEEPLTLTLVIPGSVETHRAMLNRFASCHVGNGWYDVGRMIGILFG